MTLAIKGHTTRGKEVTQLLEMLGGKRIEGNEGTVETHLYYIDNDCNNTINWDYAGLAEMGDYCVFTLEEFEGKYPYKVGDKVLFGDLDTDVWTIESMSWNQSMPYDDWEVEYIISDSHKSRLCGIKAKHLKPYKEETNMKEDNKTTGSRIDFSLTERIELDLGDTHEVVVENGKTYVVKKKPTYPKDYVECCECLKHNPFINNVSGYRRDTIGALQTLITYRDAYWKIAGEEMGLDKPWEQDYDDRCFIIANNNGNIHTYEYHGNNNVILAFPTEEMRNAFYENFRELIEQCKELL